MKRCSPRVLEFSQSMNTNDIAAMILLVKDELINMNELYFMTTKFSLILQVPAPQNGQTHLNYSHGLCVFGHFVGLALKGLNLYQYQGVEAANSL